MKKWMMIALMGACFGMMACDEDSSPSNGGTVSSLCEGTGGTLEGDACVCSGEKCTEAKWCDSNGKCGGGSTNPDICADCPNTCPAPTSVEYCTNDVEVNGEKIAGQVYKCIGTDCENTPCLGEDGKTPLSCSGRQCGVCLNSETKCENDPETQQGRIYTCREGAWVEAKSCGDKEHPVSCQALECKDEDKPCTHIDEGICGECQEGSFKCVDGNVPQDTSYIDYEGRKFTLPQGFIIGMRSKCVNGKWKKLDIDDPENCFYGHLPKDQYPTYKLGTKDIVTVFGYDSYGKSTGREYRVSACMEDGINCGECFYSFSYCSNSTSLTCRKGKVEVSNCPTGMCATSNSCFPASTEAYCKGDSCQNCKSICNW